ncbi:MAG: DUF1003 domain-containing protein [Armatimonadota bacterium]
MAIERACSPPDTILCVAGQNDWWGLLAMPERRDALITCQICHHQCAAWEMIPVRALSPVLVELARRKYPEISADQQICTSCLAQLRDAFIAQALLDEQEQTKASMRETDESMQGFDQLINPVDQNITEEITRARTVGERISDAVTNWVGSWSFFAANIVFLAIWILFNSLAVFVYHFDPYPFIFLNLVVSWISVLEAPLIMMSQNRQDTRDRLRDEHDYQVNMAAETEVRMLHRKLDQLLLEYWPTLVEIQRIQMELMEQVARNHSYPPAEGTDEE